MSDKTSNQCVQIGDAIYCQCGNPSSHYGTMGARGARVVKCEPPPELRMDAYYYGFGSTGVPEIDRILSAIACAGKSYHHTESWQDECEPYDGHTGNTPVDWIWNAAKDAADAWRARPAPETKADHICGTPDAMCDVDCMERAYRHEEGTALTIKFRPLLVCGSYGESPSGPVILIDSEQPTEQQLTTLWHEVLHLVLAALNKAHDENWIETMARRFAAACPDLLTQPRATEKTPVAPKCEGCDGTGGPSKNCAGCGGTGLAHEHDWKPTPPDAKCSICGAMASDDVSVVQEKNDGP